MTTLPSPSQSWGSWPVRMHADRFFGTVQADGQHPRVAALACYKGDVVGISLVGYDTSVSAVLASLWLRESVPFLPDEDLAWQGPRSLKRRPEAYKQLSVQLPGTKEVHALAVPTSAHLAEGILHPPDLPRPPKQETQEAQGVPHQPKPQQPSPPSIDRTRFVLGNWDEETPAERSFLGTLYGMRVLFLHRDHQHPEWPQIWAREIWLRGCKRSLIVPLKEVVGLKAWILSDNLVAWGKLIGEGVCAGWLPWQGACRSPEAHDGHHSTSLTC